MITTSRTNDTAKENFITDQGSTRLMLSLALRGPREAPTVAVVRAARTASVTRTAPAVALLTTERSVAAPIAVLPIGLSPFLPSSDGGVGIPAGLVKAGPLAVVASDWSAGTVARPMATLPSAGAAAAAVAGAAAGSLGPWSAW